MEQKADPFLLSRIKWSQNTWLRSWLSLLNGFTVILLCVCVCVCPRLILHAHPAAEHANLLNAPRELLAPSSSGWSLSTHRCHHSRHLNTWPHPWRRQGRGWFGDPPFCRKRHVWVWEHYRTSSKTANTNNKGRKKGRSLIICPQRANGQL